MNERIKELVDVTAEAVPGVYSLKYEDGGVGVEFTEAALQKFAELIVQECAELVESYRDEMTFYRADFRIKEHFGVE